MALGILDISNFTSLLTRNINRTSNALNKNLAQLSSGLRINAAADDAAGLALSSSLESSIRNLDQSYRNAADVGSALNIADGALGQVQNITGRLQELATTAANGTLSDEQRGAIQAEYSALTQEIERIGATTSFNGKQLLDGSTISPQVGPGSEGLQVGGVNLPGLASSLSSQDLSTQGGAQNALSAIQNFSEQLNSQRSSAIGAGMSRLESMQDTLQTRRLGETEALSRIRDADIAGVSADFNRNKALQQYQAALMSQSSSLYSSTFRRLLG